MKVSFIVKGGEMGRKTDIPALSKILRWVSLRPRTSLEGSERCPYSFFVYIVKLWWRSGRRLNCSAQKQLSHTKVFSKDYK